jgi:hypothetical protein
VTTDWEALDEVVHDVVAAGAETVDVNADFPRMCSVKARSSTCSRSSNVTRRMP